MESKEGVGYISLILRGDNETLLGVTQYLKS